MGRKRSIVHDGFGPVDRLRLAEVERAVGDDEVLVLVRVASAHPDVWHLVTGTPFVLRLMGAGLRRPTFSAAWPAAKRLGADRVV